MQVILVILLFVIFFAWLDVRSSEKRKIKHKKKKRKQKEKELKKKEKEPHFAKGINPEQKPKGFEGQGRRQ